MMIDNFARNYLESLLKVGYRLKDEELRNSTSRLEAQLQIDFILYLLSLNETRQDDISKWLAEETKFLLD